MRINLFRLLGAALMLGGLALLAGQQTAGAAIALQDGSTAIIVTTNATATIPVTVTTGAKVLVLLVEDKNAPSNSEPSSISWNGTNLTRGLQDDLAATTFRGDAIYYLYNPPVATALTLSVTVPGANDVSLTAFTLNGVDTTVAPLTNAINSSSITNASFAIANVIATSWAVVNATWSAAGIPPTITGTGGSANINTITAATNTSVTAGYISGLSGGTVTFQSIWTNTAPQKMNFAAMVFSPAIPPTITVQPASISVNTNQTATFSVTGSGATGYQWYTTNSGSLTILPADSGSTHYVGSQTAGLTFPNAALTDAANYVVVLTNANGSVTSSVVTLTVNAAVTLAQLHLPFSNAGPGTTTASDTSSGGINVTLNMTTNGTLAADLHGAAGTGVTNINSVNTSFALDFTTNRVITQGNNQPGGLSSPGGNPGPMVSLENNATLATLGNNGNITNFTVSFWIKQHAIMTNNNAPRLWELTKGATAGDFAGNANELSMQLQHPNEIYFELGNSAVTLDKVFPSNLPVDQWLYFAVTYDGRNFILYYGQDGTAATPVLTNVLAGKSISLGAAASLVLGNRDTDYIRSFNGWFQDFQFYNACASPNLVESIRAAAASLPTTPVITVQPKPAAAYPGQAVSFSVTAAGGAPNSYFWRTNGVLIGADGAGFSGSTTTTLSVNPVSAVTPVSYDVVVTNSFGSMTSSVAVLTILTPGSPGSFTLNFGGTPISEIAGLDWNTTNVWNPGGLPASYAAFSNPGSSYEVLIGSLLRTPTPVSIATFPGSLLKLDGSGVFANASLAAMGELRIKHTGVNPATNYYGHLVLNGGEVLNADSGRLVLQGWLDVQASSVFYIDNNDGRQEQVDAYLSGAGNIFWHDATLTNGVNALIINGATNTFTGQWVADQGVLLGAGPAALGTNNILVGGNGLAAAFETLYDVNSPSARLTVGAIGQVLLHQNDTFKSVKVNGTLLAPGTYSFATLNAAYPTNFPAIWPQVIGSTFTTGSGQITVADVAPVASPISLGGLSGVAQTLRIIGGKYAPTDADGDSLVVSAVQSPSAQGGTVTTDGTSVTYTALATFTGTDTFTYTVNDGNGGTVTATVTVSVVANGQGYNQLGAQLVSGNAVLQYVGIPGYQYALDWTHSLTPPIVWVPVVTNAAASNGSLYFTNTPSGGSDFYRTRYVP